MTEQLLQFIWQFRYFNADQLRTTAGEPLEIIYPGRHNINQGPDFLNARINCAGTLLAGSVEIHVNASEWLSHGHSADPNYNNVILHVVLNEDKPLNLSFPTLELHDRIPSLLPDKYQRLMEARRFIPCGEQARPISDISLLAWKQRLLAERLQERSAAIGIILERTHHHWEETFWQVLARNFGMKINADAFERMAVSLPLKILARHKLQLQQLEALLMGQAGLLSQTFDEDYPIMLQKEYLFLQKKYALPGSHIPVHFLRMRPANFPTLRLAQLAMLLHSSEHLFTQLKDAVHLKDAEALLSVTANDYWHYHYRFDEPSPFKKKMMGTQMTDNIMLNTVLPMLYAYGWYNNAEQYKIKALGWAEELKAEKNNIIAGFLSLGLQSNSAADSQALIQLKTKYCDEKRCLDCAIGNSILKTSQELF